MRNFIAESDFLGTFADRAVSGAAKTILSSLGCGYFCKQRTSPMGKTQNSLLRWKWLKRRLKGTTELPPARDWRTAEDGCLHDAGLFQSA